MLSMAAPGIMRVLPDHTTSRNVAVVDLEFSVDSLPILSVVGGPAKPASFSATEAKLHMLTSCHRCNGPILQESGEKTVTRTSHHPMTYGGTM